MRTAMVTPLAMIIFIFIIQLYMKHFHSSGKTITVVQVCVCGGVASMQQLLTTGPLRCLAVRPVQLPNGAYAAPTAKGCCPMHAALLLSPCVPGGTRPRCI